MLRIQTPLQLGKWLAAIAALAAGFIDSRLSAQQPTAVPRLATTTDSRPGASPSSTQDDPLLEQLNQAIHVTSNRYLTANVHSPWQIFHGILALKRDFQLVLGNDKVNALEWIATSEPRYDNQPLLLKTAHGAKFHPFTRPWAFEGHPSQFLALMSQSDLPREFEFKIGAEKVTIADMLNNTMKEVNSKEEVTWVLWALQHYCTPDTRWVNQFGEAWSIEKLVQIETAAPVVGAACGGNHRLFALTRTRDKHLKLGGKLEGVWAQADLKIRQHVELARQLQNSDGTFSAKFYQAPGYTDDMNQRFNTTGHTMEFLSIGLADNRLNEPWVRNAVSVLSRELIQSRQRQIDCGPLYHSLNALIIYRDRIWPKLPPTLASTSPSATQPTLPAPALDSKPVPLPTDLPSQPNLKRIEVSTPPSVTEVRKPDDLSKPTTLPLKPPVNGPAKSLTQSIPHDVGSSSKGDSSHGPARLPTFIPMVTTIKTLDPNRVVSIQPLPQPPAGSRPPALLPADLISSDDDLNISSDEPESFDTTTGTLKPRFANPPPASRGGKKNDTDTPNDNKSAASPKVLLIEDPVSAISPMNQ